MKSTNQYCFDLLTPDLQNTWARWQFGEILLYKVNNSFKALFEPCKDNVILNSWEKADLTVETDFVCFYFCFHKLYIYSCG